MPEVLVETTARLHFGFTNLSTERNRLFGSLGVAIDRPHAEIRAEPADGVEAGGAAVETDGADLGWAAGDDARADLATVEEYARTAASLLGVDGARVAVESAIPAHVGLGSGTQLALGVLTAVAAAHGLHPDRRRLAPALGRGRRSGVGVAAFESGGFVYDAGQPTETVAAGDRWEVAPVVVGAPVPEDWRFVVAIREGATGRRGSDEAARMERAMERADPATAAEISTCLVDAVLPGVVTGDLTDFGTGVERVGRLNGEWYADSQDGVYRPAARPAVRTFRDHPDVAGAGQSSWGPAAYAVTRRDAAPAVAEAVDGTDTETFVARPDNTGHAVRRVGAPSGR